MCSTSCRTPWPPVFRSETMFAGLRPYPTEGGIKPWHPAHKVVRSPDQCRPSINRATIHSCPLKTRWARCRIRRILRRTSVSRRYTRRRATESFRCETMFAGIAHGPAEASAKSKLSAERRSLWRVTRRHSTPAHCVHDGAIGHSSDRAARSSPQAPLFDPPVLLEA